jgi:hypothetical protein
MHLAWHCGEHVAWGQMSCGVAERRLISPLRLGVGPLCEDRQNVSFCQGRIHIDVSLWQGHLGTPQFRPTQKLYSQRTKQILKP